MAWKIEFHKKALEEFHNLPLGLKEEFLYVFDLVKTDGLLSISHKHNKYVEDGLRELRAKSSDGIARSLYVAESEQTLRILLVFVKKTEKTPREFIDLAKKRRGEPN